MISVAGRKLSYSSPEHIYNLLGPMPSVRSPGGSHKPKCRTVAQYVFLCFACPLPANGPLICLSVHYAYSSTRTSISLSDLYIYPPICLSICASTWQFIKRSFWGLSYCIVLLRRRRVRKSLRNRFAPQDLAKASWRHACMLTYLQAPLPRRPGGAQHIAAPLLASFIPCLCWE